MTEIERNKSTPLDEEDAHIATFERHSSFVRIADHYLEPAASAFRDTAHLIRIKTLPTQFDRSNLDDVERVGDEVMIQLAGEVDHFCLETVISHASISVEDVSVETLDHWIRQKILEIRVTRRSDCGVDVLFDTELNYFVTEKQVDGDSVIDLGWLTSATYGLNRHQPITDHLYVLVCEQHIVPLASHLALFLTSHAMDERTEYLSAECEFAYSPRIEFHPGAVMVARISFTSEHEWRSSVLNRHQPE